jgi:hypothetical protein
MKLILLERCSSWNAFAAINQRSIRAMEKLGMKRNPTDEFFHPLVAV